MSDNADASSSLPHFTAEDLKHFDGTGSDAKIYISLRGTVFDVTTGAAFYGPEGGYRVFAGREASRSLAKMQISADEANAGWDNLSAEHTQTLDEWEQKYRGKYPIVGKFSPDSGFIARGLMLEP